MDTSIIANYVGSAVFTGDDANTKSLIIVMVVMAAIIIGLVGFSIYKKKKGAVNSQNKSDTVKKDNNKKE